MKKRHIFILLLVLFAAFSTKAQNISVASFRLLEMDMTANLEPNIRIDQNGYTCALIKMVTIETGFTWNVGVMGITDTQQQAGEIWVWVPFGVKHLTIGHPRFGILRDYYFPIPIEKARTYELVLKTNGPGPDEDLGGSFLVMSVNPTNAMVSVDGQLLKTADGTVTVFLEYGKHNYRVEAPDYETEVGIVQIGQEKTTMEVKLKSSLSTLSLTCTDKTAEIYINEKKYGVGNCSCTLSAGTYLVEARKQGHRAERQTIVLAKQEQKEAVLNAPSPMYGKLKLTTTPANCDVYIDGEKKGTSPDVFANILVGEHTLTLEKKDYEKKTQTFTIEEGKVQELDVTLPNLDLDAFYDKGVAHYANKEYDKALECYEKAAKHGHANAQCYLGYMYGNGHGVPQDYAKAVEWYRKAAEQGYARAQCDLGYMYGNGRGVAQDYAKAVEWYRKAVEQGNAQAQCYLGYMYDKGHGVAQDYAKAVEWYRKAAEQGYANAQYNLGVMYGNGHGVPQDYAKAVEWYRKAVEQGYASAQCNLGYMYDEGHGVAQDYAKAVEWYRKAAEQGNANAQCNLGYMYENGRGVKQDYSKAKEWYRKAAAQGHERAIKALERF